MRTEARFKITAKVSPIFFKNALCLRLSALVISLKVIKRAILANSHIAIAAWTAISTADAISRQDGIAFKTVKIV
jgi:hypothetical protein